MNTTTSISVIASDAATATARVARRLPAGMTITGRTASRYQGRIVAVEVAVSDTCDRDDAWVLLTSYGMTPDDSLGAVWQSVEGVGA